MIEAGEYASDQKLPSERELSRRFGISRITVRQALSDLAQEGRVYTRIGKGTFVTDPACCQPLGSLFGFSESVRRQGRVPSSTVLEAGLVPAEADIAGQLRIEPGSELVRLRRLRLADGVPVVLELTHLPHAAAPGLLQRIADDVSLYAVLEESYGLRMSWAEVTMGATLAGEWEAAQLRLQVPAAVLHMEQISFVEDGRPMELTRSAYRGDGYRFNAVLHRPRDPETAAMPSADRAISQAPLAGQGSAWPLMGGCASG